MAGPAARSGASRPFTGWVPKSESPKARYEVGWHRDGRNVGPAGCLAHHSLGFVGAQPFLGAKLPKEFGHALSGRVHAVNRESIDTHLTPHSHATIVLDIKS